MLLELSVALLGPLALLGHLVEEEPMVDREDAAPGLRADERSTELRRIATILSVTLRAVSQITKVAPP